jgi:hypothetical protein
MAWLRSIGRALVSAVRWVGRHTRNRLGPRGRVIFDWVVGLALIAIGVITGPVPIVQGWIFVLAGLAVLSKHSRLAHRWFEKIKRAGRGARDRLRRKD